MWQFLDSLLVLTQGWNYPLAICLTTCILTLVAYWVYRDLKAWLYKNNKYIFYAFIEAIYLPLLVFIWIASLDLLYHIMPKKVFMFLTESKIASLHRSVIPIIATWFMMRFIVSMQGAGPSNYIKNKKMMRFLFRLFYYMLVLLSFLGGLNLLGIALPETLSLIVHLFITVNFVVVLVYFSHTLLKQYAKIFAEKNAFVKQIITEAVRNPIKLLIAGAGLDFIIERLPRVGYLLLLSDFFAIVQFWDIVLLAFFWMLYRLTSLIEGHLLLGHLTEKYPDRVMVHNTGKFSRIVIIIIGVFIFFSRVKSNSIFTFFGGSAVFFGLVGKDIFPNYLSGFIIYIEDRMKVGDWVYSADQQIEGTIVSVDLRSTCIRTFDKRLLFVPNTFLVANPLCNASRMTNRRIRETIRVRRVSYEKLAKIVRDIRVMLEEHPGIDQKQLRMVHFIKFGDYSFDIDLYTFTKTRDWQTYRNVQQDVFFKIMEIIDNNGAKLAFPTRTLHVNKPYAKEVLPQ